MKLLFYVKKVSELFFSLQESGRWNEAQWEAAISSSSTESTSAIVLSSSHSLKESISITAISCRELKISKEIWDI